MENLPKNVINKIMFYTSHPVADILKASSIFKALEMNRGNRIHGSPFDRGDMDAYYGRGYDPHKIEHHNPHDVLLFVDRHRTCALTTDKEIKEYEAAHFHASDRKFGRNSVQSAILGKYGYHMVLCIRSLWTQTREEQNYEDMIPSESEGSDSDSD